jgi:hypothetical protein
MKQVAGRDVLHIAAQVGEAEGGVIEDAEKTRGATALLDIGPAGLADGGYVEAITAADEILLRGAEAVAGIAGDFHALILRAAAVPKLLFFDEGGEGEFGEAFSHKRWGAKEGFGWGGRGFSNAERPRGRVETAFAADVLYRFKNPIEARWLTAQVSGEVFLSARRVPCRLP